MADYEDARNRILARRLSFVSAALASLTTQALAQTPTVEEPAGTDLNSPGDLQDPEFLKACLSYRDYASNWTCERESSADRAQLDNFRRLANEQWAAGAWAEAARVMEHMLTLEANPKVALALIRTLMKLGRNADALRVVLKFENCFVDEAEAFAGLRAELIPKLALLRLEAELDNIPELRRNRAIVMLTIERRSDDPMIIPLHFRELPKQLCLDSGTFRVTVEESDYPPIQKSVAVAAGDRSVMRLSLASEPAGIAVPCLAPPPPPPHSELGARLPKFGLGINVSGIVPVIATGGGALETFAYLGLSENRELDVAVQALGGIGATKDTLLFPIGGGLIFRRPIAEEWSVGIAACGGYFFVRDESATKLRSAPFLEPRLALLFAPVESWTNSEFALNVSVRLSGYSSATEDRFGLTQVTLGLGYMAVVSQDKVDSLELARAKAAMSAGAVTTGNSRPSNW